MVKKKIILLFLINLISLSFLFSNEKTLYGNYIKLAVKDDACFNLYTRNSIKDQWTPLLFEDTYPTSYFKIYTDNKEVFFSKGGPGRFSDLYIKDDKIYYYWYDKDTRIDLIFQLTQDNGLDNANTLVMDLLINNKATKNNIYDFYLCLDTYLGEKTNEHFSLQDNFIIKKESKIETPENLTKISSYDKKKQLGLDVIFNKNEQQITPSLVFFANWKKVQTTVGLYSPVDGLSFDLLPNSINDSALFIQYNNQDIPSTKQNKYEFILSAKNNIRKEIIPVKKEEINNSETKKNNNVPNDNLNNLVQNKNLSSFDIKDLLDLLDSINQKLNSGKNLSDDEVNLMNKVLEEIKNKRNVK